MEHLDAVARAQPAPPLTFADRHIGPAPGDLARMLSVIGADSVEQLLASVLPAEIRTARPLDLPEPATEAAMLAELRALAARNTVAKPMIGLGFHGTITPAVIRRNVLENPAWYTAYTPYQSEISQGRLEALLNFQTMVADLTGLPIANASLLDEATAAAEAMTLIRRAGRAPAGAVLLLADEVLPRTRAVLATRAEPLGIPLTVGPLRSAADVDRLAAGRPVLGALLQYPGTSGALLDPGPVIEAVHSAGGMAVVAADLLALTLIKPPGESGADAVVGTTQRFGVPLGFGGPHAGYLAVRTGLERQLPGRLVGVSRDADGAPALRLALQTREQHIRRDKATSNICTAQVLLAVMAGLYAVYHGPAGLRAIAERVAGQAAALAAALRDGGLALRHEHFFDTVQARIPGRAAEVVAAAAARGILLRQVDADWVGVSCDETTTSEDLAAVLAAFGLPAAALPPVPGSAPVPATPAGPGSAPGAARPAIPAGLARTSGYLEHPVFTAHRSETQLLRYLQRLAAADYALDRGMIPLGSCTMKLNAAAELEPISWPEFANLHPLAPAEHAAGTLELIDDLARWLAEITGYSAVSLQPNAGSQGELAGLLAIRAYHRSRGDDRRDLCLIPASAHGTNAASAVLAGLRVEVIACDESGDVDLGALKEALGAHGDRVAAIMVTYPSTHGVFEQGLAEICGLVHAAGGQVYVDGANLNALVGLARLGEIGADVSHLNLHKTFCIPHGGGGPGVGPVAVREHLAPYLPERAGSAADGHPSAGPGPQPSAAGAHPQPSAVGAHPQPSAVGAHPQPSAAGAHPQPGVGPVAAARYGSAGILPISWAYLRMMGPDGLRRASEVAIISANYVAARLRDHYPIRFTGRSGLVAHECILDLRPLTRRSGITVEDVAKRLIDYGFHAPTMSFPVPGTLMVEPTESEDLPELDRFCDAMIGIRAEIERVATGEWPADDNPLVNAPHPAHLLVGEWQHPYTRAEAVYPGRSQVGGPGGAARPDKYWPPVRRVDNPYGDRNLVCACPPVTAFAD